MNNDSTIYIVVYTCNISQILLEIFITLHPPSLHLHCEGMAAITKMCVCVHTVDLFNYHHHLALSVSALSGS